MKIERGEMRKEFAYFSSICLLSGAILASGGYLLVSQLYYPLASWLFVLTIILASLATIKMLNSMTDSCPTGLQRLIHWLHSISFEAIAVLTTALLRPIGYWARQTASGSKAGQPILLIHGYLHDSSAWVFLKRELGRMGCGPLYTLNLKHPFRSIRDYAELIDLKVKEIARENQRNDIALIGHSMGGLVSAWYALQMNLQGQVTDVITIGSPLGGTRAAAVAIGPNGREMRFGSEFLQTLRKEMEQNSQVRFYHIASKTDQLIFPWHSALLGTCPEREYVVDDLGHMSLLLSPRIAQQIYRWFANSSYTNLPDK